MAHDDQLGTGEITGLLPEDHIPEISPLLRPGLASESAIISATAALRDEEIERTRQFIRMGWLISVVVIATVPVVAAPYVLSAVLIAGLVLAMGVSFHYHQAFVDPARYTERALVVLSVISMLNGHIGILYFGTYSGAPLMCVVGIHFVARTETYWVARMVVTSALVSYALISTLIISGVIADPGVFASDRTFDRTTLVLGTIFVLGAYLLAYYTARTFRLASLASIDELQQATRLASQREAVLEELRADLERALHPGGPGRYTDQTIGEHKLGLILGRGAMGEVYEAIHVDTGAPAAVKLLRREHLADQTLLARFLREARAAGSLDSPHVVRVLGSSSPDAPVPFLAMERLHGHTLAESLRREPRLADQATIDLCRQVARGLDAATTAQIVHRDLKPQNLMFTEDAGARVWKILDFGSAILTRDSETLTRGDLVGTPHYMAPEQAQGLRVDHRADLYALAAIAYRCITGRHVFEAGELPALLYAIVHRTPVRPGALAEVPSDVDRWFAIALAKAPADRFPSGAVLVGSLARAFAGQLDGPARRRGDGLILKSPWEAA
ncbi:MAG: serine/threonine-protein kinase [Kofleriaceae bacterium]